MDINAITLKVPGPGATDLYFYKEVDRDSVGTFVHDIQSLNIELSQIESDNQDTINKLYDSAKLLYKPTPINVHINTPGGECYSGFAMTHIIEQVYNTRPVNMIVDGFCASMGISLLLSVPIEHRFAYKNSTFMIHQVSTFMWGKVSDLKETVDEAERINKRIWDMILTKTNITKERMEECYNTRQDWFISAEEALELGLISKII